MNERIKELSEQALQYSLFNVGIDSELYTPVAMEKFAELIVEECAKKIERDYKYVKGTDTEWNTAFSIACDLKEHFGVE